MLAINRSMKGDWARVCVEVQKAEILHNRHSNNNDFLDNNVVTS